MIKNIIYYLLVMFMAISAVSCNNEQKQDTVSELNRRRGVVDMEGEVFQNQTLKQGERIVKINWGMERTVRLIGDNDAGHFASSEEVVPFGKKWIMLFASEDYLFEGSEVSMVPMLSVDNKVKAVYGMKNVDKNNINLSRTKDENNKYYSGTNIRGVSNRKKGLGYGDNFYDYKGEVWFIEINE